MVGKREAPTPRTVAGRTLRCPYCDHDRFWTRKGQLNTRLATFFDLDWLNPEADVYICEGCGHVDWFLPL